MAQELTRRRELATVAVGYIDTPTQLLRFIGREAIVLAVDSIAGINVVKMGELVVRSHCNSMPVQ